MPRTALIFIAVICAAFGAAACNSNNSTPSSTPTVVPSATFTPNPKIHVAVLQVTVSGTPTVNIPVAMSTPKSNANPQPGTPFKTLKTGADGVVRFFNLNYKQTYCWVATLGATQQASICATSPVWQNTSPIIIGT